MARAVYLPDCNAATVTSSNSNELTAFRLALVWQAVDAAAAANAVLSKNVRRVMAERILYFPAFRTIRGPARGYRSHPAIYPGAGARYGESAARNRCHAVWIAGYY